MLFEITACQILQAVMWDTATQYTLHKRWLLKTNLTQKTLKYTFHFYLEINYFECTSYFLSRKEIQVISEIIITWTVSLKGIMIDAIRCPDVLLGWRL